MIFQIYISVRMSVIDFAYKSGNPNTQYKDPVISI